MTCYPQDGKRKSFDICSAFAEGCGGQIVVDGKYRGGPAAFYGVVASNVQAWRDVQASGEDWYYIDNAYFDATRQQYFRVTKNALQHSGIGLSDGNRFSELGIEIKPWRKTGEHVVVCPHSDAFMERIANYSGNWLWAAKTAIRDYSSRPVLVRAWSADKAMLAATLESDLAGAHALVTWSSAASVTAVLCGVPVVCMGACVASPMGGRIENIETLPMPERENWAGVLADHQFTLDEMRSGETWAALS